MKLPNKLFSVNESCIGTFPIILEILQKENISVFDLYQKVKKKFNSVTDYIETLDALFYLGKIDLYANTEELKYVN